MSFTAVDIYGLSYGPSEALGLVSSKFRRFVAIVQTKVAVIQRQLVESFDLVSANPLRILYLSPVVSQPGCLARLSGWTGSFVSLCLPSFVSQPGCLARLGFICLPLSPFICLPLSPSLDAWVDRFTCLPLSPFICRPLSPSLDLARLSGWTGSCVSLCPLHLSPGLSQPGCLARLSGWTGSFVSLCLVSRCLPAWMPGAALWVDGFICLPLSPRMSGTPLFPFICLPLSPSLDAWHCFFCGQIHFSPFVSLHLAPVVSQPGCLSRLSRRTDSLVSLGSPSFVSHLWTDSFVSLCLPLFVSRCLPAWMPLWVDGFICLPLSPSLDVWHLRSAVSFTSRGSVLLAESGLPSASGFGHSLSCGCWGQSPLSALHLDFDFAWARGGSSSLSIVGYTLSVRSVPRYQLRPLSVLARIWSPELTRAVRCGARLQLREGSVNPPVKQT